MLQRRSAWQSASLVQPQRPVERHALPRPAAVHASLDVAVH
ncbi:MAG: hypothetical protein U0326_29100 [Polyangiales bacterium]